MQSATVTTICPTAGTSAFPTTVTASLQPSLAPGIHISGVPEHVATDARCRVRCAIKAAGFELPRTAVTVAVTRCGDHHSGLDLPIAAAVLAATRQIPEIPDTIALVGELDLDGCVLPVPCLAAMQVAASRASLRLACPPAWDVTCHVPLRRLDALRGLPDAQTVSHNRRATDLRHLLLIGDSARAARVARSLPAALPPLDDASVRECVTLRSCAGVPAPELLYGAVPFRAPHHSISMSGLVGGGKPVRPGEISLAHRGVLYLDEPLDFSTAALRALDVALQDRCVRIARTDASYVFPCDLRLVCSVADGRDAAELRRALPHVDLTAIVL